MRYEVRVGELWEIENAKIIRAKRSFVRENARTWICFTFVVTAALFLSGAGIIGIYEADFKKLADVYQVVAAPVWMILGFYVRGRGS